MQFSKRAHYNILPLNLFRRRRRRNPVFAWIRKKHENITVAFSTKRYESISSAIRVNIQNKIAERCWYELKYRVLKRNIIQESFLLVFHFCNYVVVVWENNRNLSLTDDFYRDACRARYGMGRCTKIVFQYTGVPDRNVSKRCSRYYYS